MEQFIEATFRLQKLHRVVFHGSNIHKNLNLPINKTQVKTLLAIYYNKDNKMSDISRRMGMEKGSFTTLIDHLICLGYVQRKRSELDKRRVCLCLTEQGLKIAQEIEVVFQNQSKKAIDTLTKQEQEELMQAMRTINKYANKIEENRRKEKTTQE